MKKKLMYVPTVVLAMSSLCVANPITVLADEVAPTAQTDSSTVDTTTTTTAQQTTDQTTVPNNVETAVPDENYQGTNASAKYLFFNVLDVNVTPQDAKDGKTVDDLGGLPAGDLLLKGDVSISKDGSSDYDSQTNSAYEVEKNGSYTLKADLDVSSVTASIEKTAETINKKTGKDANTLVVNNLETGMRANFSFNEDLNGNFYVSKYAKGTEEYKKDMAAHYQLVSVDGRPLIYGIDWDKSEFNPTKVSLVMSLDLSNMTTFENQNPLHNKDNPDIHYLYGENGTMENFNHNYSDLKDGANATQTSTLGNLRKLIENSAQKMSLFIRGLTFTSDANTQGSISANATGYIKANVTRTFKSPVSFTWGAVQTEDGQDGTNPGDKISLTVKVKEEKKSEPSSPTVSQTASTSTKEESTSSQATTNTSGVQTGVADSMATPAMGMVAAGLGLIALRKSRKE